MRPRLTSIILLLTIFSSTGFAQRVKIESIVRNIDADHYFRFYYENDFVFLTDCYYTSGMNIELVKPSFQKNPVNKVFFHVKGSKTVYGIALDHYAFTPLDYVEPKILYGDRPYAGCISINSFRMVTNKEKRKQISTSLILGLIGPDAFWGPTQYFFHKHFFKAPVPQGWHNQISNDIILNYKVDLEKNFFTNHFFILNGSAEAVAGTLNDKISAGLNLMIGKINDPFSSSEAGSKKYQAYLFGQSFVSAVGYDGTMQGGLFDKTSPYTISSSDITHFTFQSQAGIMISFKKISVEYAETYLTKEFRTGLTHRWASFGIVVKLK